MASPRSSQVHAVSRVNEPVVAAVRILDGNFRAINRRQVPERPLHTLARPLEPRRDGCGVPLVPALDLDVDIRYLLCLKRIRLRWRCCPAARRGIHQNLSRPSKSAVETGVIASNCCFAAAACRTRGASGQVGEWASRRRGPLKRTKGRPVQLHHPCRPVALVLGLLFSAGWACAVWLLGAILAGSSALPTSLFQAGITQTQHQARIENVDRRHPVPLPSLPQVNHRPTLHHAAPHHHTPLASHTTQAHTKVAAPGRRLDSPCIASRP